jgi:hypothetical protein
MRRGAARGCACRCENGQRSSGLAAVPLVAGRRPFWRGCVSDICRGRRRDRGGCGQSCGSGLVVAAISRAGSLSLILNRMLTWLRRSRAMALVMVLLAPGIAGTGVQWLHSCPADAQASADHQHHNSPPSDPAGHSNGCECIGSCLTAALVARPGAAILAVLEPPQPRVPSFSGHGFVPVRSPTHLLPPATAPPLS